jgi:DNA-binding PucR family transcriptional regulator
VLVLVADAPTPGDRAEAGSRRRHLLESLAEVCKRRAPDALTLVRPDELVVLVAEAHVASDVGRVAVQQAEALAPSWLVTVGIGELCRAATDIARSHEQARRAVDAGRRFGRRGDVVSFEELGVYRLLFHVQDPGELRGFVDQVLGPLLEYDARHQAHLVLTLATFLEHNGSLQASARQLSLHVNSVAYRLQRIQAISRIDLEQSEDRLLAQVALKIHAATTSE